MGRGPAGVKIPSPYIYKEGEREKERALCRYLEETTQIRNSNLGGLS